MSEPNEISRPLRSRWKIRHKTLPGDQNVFGTDLKSRKTGTHYGWDLEAAVGTPVFAVGGPGKVIHAESLPGYGSLVMHDFPFRGKTYYVVYAHLSDRKVKAGDAISAGQLIGHTGISGNADSEDPHLHLEFHDSAGLTKGPPGKVNPTVFYGAPPY